MPMSRQQEILPGLPNPLGVSLRDGGVNVAVVSRHAERIFFCLFDESGERELVRYALPERIGEIHFGFISGIAEGSRYGLRADGPWDPANGHRFDPAKLLVDPYAYRLDRPFAWAPQLAAPRPMAVDTAQWVPKALVSATPEPITPGPARRPGVIYELSVRGFTHRHPEVPEAIRGTVAALAHPAIIRHFRKLGVDTIELMPLAAWIDERHLSPLGLSNAWGYNPVCFMAPDPRLAPGGLAEIRDTVSAFHAEGINVVVDVVFNHTGESDTDGATLSLRGLDNALYYRHATNNPGVLVNDTGCGNTLALDRVPVVRLAVDAMRHWVLTTGIDGFRFDLASVMGRTPHGFTPDSPMLAVIEQDPLLSDRVLIAEPWDIGHGGYRLGGFPPDWHEWNDRYRDDVRRFWRGDQGALGALATRLAGSSDLFSGGQRLPSTSVNFLSAHDGFTLRDLVSYSRKHNEANGENNRDGKDGEIAWNHGHEGPTADTAINARRRADVRALLATLLFSRGTPMLAAGDEFGRSQRGNNNAYAQDNEWTWLDWSHADTDLLEFTAQLIHLRQRHPALSADRFLTGNAASVGELPDGEWLNDSGASMTAADWSDPARMHLGLSLLHGDDHVAIWINAGSQPVSITLRQARDNFEWQLEACSSPVTSEGTVPARSVALFAEVASRSAHRHSGTSDELVAAVARETGIHTEWWEVDGTHHRVPLETLRMILDALQLPVSSRADARAALHTLAAERKRALPATLVLQAGVEKLVVRGGAESGVQKRSVLHIAPHGHEPMRMEFSPGAALRIPPLPAGYHNAWVEDEPDARCRLIVSPGQCYLPEALLKGERWFGLSAHLYALRHQGDLGIGDFGTLAHFAEASGRLGGMLVGINPLHHLFPTERERASPYQPSDRRFIDPIYIDIAQLLDAWPLQRARELANARSAAFAELSALRNVDYSGVWAAKNAVLDAAFGEFMAIGGDPAFVAFVTHGGIELERHGVFEALATLHGTVDRNCWPEEHRHPDSAAVKRFSQANHRAVLYRAWLQWIADGQLKLAASRASAAGLQLGLFRDLALGTAYEGGETWADPDLFAASLSLGAPPDPFARNGQVWNLPPFSPRALEATGFVPFIRMMASNMAHAGVLRIDHILGFARQFWVPRGANGDVGAYIDFPMETLIAITAIESQRHRCAIIGEDLGTVPDGLRDALAAANILSYRMLWFEREGRGFKPARGYPRMAASCIGSHDVAPFAGWHAQRDIAVELEFGLLKDEAAIARKHADREDEHKALLASLAADHLATGDSAASECEAVHEFVARSPSALMLVQVDEMIGETEPLNLPGTDMEYPNWRRRLATPVEDLPAHSGAHSLIERVKQGRRTPPGGQS